MSANLLLEKISACREKLRAHLGKIPDFGVIAGTGLKHLIDDLTIAGRVSYADIGFPVSTVSSHAGELVWGRLGDREVFVLNGRFHLYEGFTPQEIATPIRALAQEGMRHLVITNAAGGLDNHYHPGEVLLIRDHINATGRSPLTGAHDPSWGERFPDMSQVWDKTAAAEGITLHQGTYICVPGPQLETPAETRIYKNTGARAIGMSTVMEAIAAVQAGVRLAGLSAITNINDPDDMAATSLDAIVDAADLAAPALRKFITALAEQWH